MIASTHIAIDETNYIEYVMEIKVHQPVTVNLKTAKLYMKVRDEFQATFVDSNGNEILDYEGYVPGFFPGDNYGDYLILDIDMDTGLITNWKLDPHSVQEFIDKHTNSD